jgi:hypothetical protein
MTTMDRRKRPQGAPAESNDADVAANQRPRRAVVDKMRRKIERALAVGDAADELAKSAQAVLIAADAEQIVLDSRAISALRAATARYREVTTPTNPEGDES